MKRLNIKLLISSLVILVMLLGTLTGCITISTPETPGTTTPAEPAPAPTPINPGWTLKNYVAVLFVLMGVALTMSAVTRRFKHFLEIDRAAQEVREIHRGLFGEKIKSIPFRSVEGSKVSQEAWHHTHTLKGWTLHLKIKNQRPLFIAYRTRDLQPQDRGYLEILRNRMNYLIFG